MSDKWTNVLENDIDSSNAVAVRREGYHPQWNNGRLSHHGLKQIANAMGFEKIYGIPTKYFKNFCKKHNIPELEEVAPKKAKQAIKNLTVYERANYHHGQPHPKILLISDELEGLSKTCDDFITASRADCQLNYNIQCLLNICEEKVPDAPNFEEIFYDRYPLLKHAQSCTKTEDIIEYIKLKEKKK
jgi:hypothetical protein